MTNISPAAARKALSAIALGSATEPDEQVLALAGLVIADELRMNNLVAIRGFGLAGGEVWKLDAAIDRYIAGGAE